MKLSKISLTAFFFLAQLPVSAQSQTTAHNLMPVPASLRFNSGRLAITPSFTIAVTGHSDARLLAAIDRMARRLEARTGLTFARGLASDAASATLVILCLSAGEAIPSVNEDESYLLEVSNSQAVMNAPTVVGALRGLETFLQLLGGGADGYSIPAVSIQDKPRFPWRGLLIDIGRHWAVADEDGGGHEFVEPVWRERRHSEHARPVLVAGNEHHAAYVVVANVVEQLGAFGGEAAPRVVAARGCVEPSAGSLARDPQEGGHRPLDKGEPVTLRRVPAEVEIRLPGT